MGIQNIFQYIIISLLILMMHSPVKCDEKWQSHILQGARMVKSPEIDITKVPYQCGLRTSSGMCGCAIISSRFVLTAGHCVRSIVPESNPMHFGYDMSDIQVRVGTNEFRSNHNTRYEVRAVKIHEKYGPFGENDIALIMLSEPLQLNSHVQKIDLPQKEPPVGSSLYASGYGNNINNLVRSKLVTYTLRGEYIRIVDREECKKLWKRNRKVNITNGHICAKFGDDQQHPDQIPDTCTGDSGGPLADLESGILYGIVSFGAKKCGGPNDAPGVYTNVAAYVSWIKNSIKELCYQ